VGQLKRLNHAVLVLASSLTLLAQAPVAVGAPAPATSRLTGTAASLQDDSYLLGPGDQLELRLYDAPELSGQLTLLNDGSAMLPLLGSVRLTGLSLGQASQWLTLLYKRQLLRPQLQLRVLMPRPIRVAIVGEVVRPGLYSLSTSESSQTAGATNSISGLPTLVDGVQKAGGVSLNADLRQVVVQRRLPGEPLRFKRIRLNLLELLQQGDQLQNPFLFDGDTIQVMRAKEPVAESIEVAATNLSPAVITVNLVGEVLRPGPLRVGANTPLVQAVLAAGGPNAWRANKSNVELVRLNRNGTVSRERFQLNLSQGASNQRNPPLRDGDTVIVNRSGLAVASDAITAVGGPLTSLANILTLLRLAGTANTY